MSTMTKESVSLHGAFPKSPLWASMMPMMTENGAENEDKKISFKKFRPKPPFLQKSIHLDLNVVIIERQPHGKEIRGIGTTK